MKYSIDFTNKFKKSLRKGMKRGLDPVLIEKAVEKLSNEGKLPLCSQLNIGNYTNWGISWIRNKIT